MSNNKQIAVSARTESGNNGSRRLRHAGIVPAVFYGKGLEAQNIQMTVSDWVTLGAKVGEVIELTGAVNAKVEIKEIQFNYLKNHTVHVDFKAE